MVPLFCIGIALLSAAYVLCHTQGYKVTLTTGGISARGKNVVIIAQTLDCDTGNVTGANCTINVSGE